MTSIRSTRIRRAWLPRVRDISVHSRLAPVNQTTNAVGWTFKVADSVLEKLQVGQTITQKYVVAINDGHGGTAKQTVTVTIIGTNDAPIADNEVNTTPEDTPISVPASAGLLAGDTDVDGGPLVLTTFKVAGIPTAFAAGSTASIPGIGSLTIKSDGSYTFVPSPNYNGPVPVATYTVSDGRWWETGHRHTDLECHAGVMIRWASDGLAGEGAGLTVFESNLPAGTAPAAAALTQTGTFHIFAGDGIGSLTIGGQAVITGGVFTARTFTTPLGNTLAITGFNPATGIVSYSYTLTGAETHEKSISDSIREENFHGRTRRRGSRSRYAKLDAEGPYRR